MDTLLLDTENWDLCVNSSGHIAVASNPYSLAQGAACAIKTFIGENYYNVALGVPYFQQILGKTTPLSVIKDYLVQAALTVPDVVEAQCFISSFENGVLSGQVQVTDKAGTLTVAAF